MPSVGISDKQLVGAGVSERDLDGWGGGVFGGLEGWVGGCGKERMEGERRGGIGEREKRGRKEGRRGERKNEKRSMS